MGPTGWAMGLGPCPRAGRARPGALRGEGYLASSGSGSQSRTVAPRVLSVTICAPPPCASAMALTIARPSPVPPRVRAASPRAKRSKARSARSGSKPGPWSATSSATPPSSLLRLARSTTSPRPWRSALSTRLPRAWRRRRSSASTRSPSPPSTVSSRPCSRARSANRARTPSSSGLTSIASRRIESCPSAALAVERAAQPVEHLVERLPQPAHLVLGGGQRQPLAVAGERDRAGAAPHRLDGAQPGRGEQVAEQRGEQDGDRAAHRERRDEAREGLVAVVERLPDDHDRFGEVRLGSARHVAPGRRRGKIGGGRPPPDRAPPPPGRRLQ